MTLTTLYIALIVMAVVSAIVGLSCIIVGSRSDRQAGIDKEDDKSG